MNTIAYFKERFDQLQPNESPVGLDKLRAKAFDDFSTMGIPGSKDEEWKYTRISGLFNKEFQLPVEPLTGTIHPDDLKAIRLPGYENANELVFINGFYSFSLSRVRSAGLKVLSLR